MTRLAIAALAAAALLPLAGCTRAVKATSAPPPPPVEMVSVPPPTHPTEPIPEEPTETVNVAPVIPPPRPTPPRRRTPPATPPPAQTAVAAPPPIDLGQLTTGAGDGNNTLRQQTEELMRVQNRRLASVPSAVGVLHTQQLEQARLFLRQADDAWKKLDVDGAHTLAIKAKVVLDEVLQ